MDNFQGVQRAMLSTAETGTPLVSRGHLSEQKDRGTESLHCTTHLYESKALNRPPNGGTSRTMALDSL